MSALTANPTVTLDDLIALSDEIASLVRAGVPLERGLHELGGDLPGRLGQLARSLAERTARGESLADALDESGARLPQIYRAVVEAGVRGGRLPAALQSVAASMRRLADTRRNIVLAALYPLLVIVVAWAFFAFFTAAIAPRLLDAFRAMDVPGSSAFVPLVVCGRVAWIWGTLGPAILIVLAGLWWYGATRATVAGSHAAMRFFGWVPWLKRTLHWSRAASFTEILALLVENHVPLDQSLRLAGEASGDPEVAAAAVELSDAVRRGATARGLSPFSPEKPAIAETATGKRGLSPLAHPDPCRALPRLLVLRITSGPRERSLLPALRHAADNYRRHAQYQADQARLWLPVLLTLGFSGVVTLFCALAVFWPYITILRTFGATPR